MPTLSLPAASSAGRAKPVVEPSAYTEGGEPIYCTNSWGPFFELRDAWALALPFLKTFNPRTEKFRSDKEAFKIFKTCVPFLVSDTGYLFRVGLQN